MMDLQAMQLGSKVMIFLSKKMALRTKRVAPHSKICERFKSLMAIPAATYTFCQAKHLRCWIQFMWLMFYKKKPIFSELFM